MSGLKTFSSALTAVMLVIFTTMVVIATGYPAGARFMPYIVGIPGIVFCLVQLALDWRMNPVQPWRSGQPKSQNKETLQPSVEYPEEDPPLVRRELLIWGYFLAFIGLILAFGFYCAVPVLLVTFLRFEGRTSWLVAVAAAVAGTTLLYLAFAHLLRLQLFAGHLGPSIIDALGGA